LLDTLVCKLAIDVAVLDTLVLIDATLVCNDDIAAAVALLVTLVCKLDIAVDISCTSPPAAAVFVPSIPRASRICSLSPVVQSAVPERGIDDIAVAALATLVSRLATLVCRLDIAAASELSAIEDIAVALELTFTATLDTLVCKDVIDVAISCTSPPVAAVLVPSTPKASRICSFSPVVQSAAPERGILDTAVAVELTRACKEDIETALLDTSLPTKVKAVIVALRLTLASTELTLIAIDETRVCNEAMLVRLELTET